MISDRSMELAKYYLEKHIHSGDDVGLGPYLEAGGRISLFTQISSTFVESLRLRLWSEGYVDCGTIARVLRLDMFANNPELNPKLMTNGNGFQNWVEISDPKSGKTIQIDASPWYCCLNHGLKGLENRNFDEVREIRLEKSRGRIMSVKRTETIIITCSLFGFLTPLQMPSFVLQAKTTTYAQIMTGAAQIYIDVLDPTELHYMQKVSDFDLLVASRKIEIGTITSQRSLFDCKTRSASRNQLIERIANQNDEMAEEIKRNFAPIVQILKRVRRSNIIKARAFI